ncbi:DHH family protein [uncultured archaeon]|nr:DHH family protein [uncultured archaeon]
MAKTRTTKSSRPPSAKSLFSKFKGKRAILTFHSLADIDAAASAIALQRFIGKSAIIAAPDRPTAAARKLFDFAKVPYTLFSDIQATETDAIILLDSSSPHLLSHLAGKQIDLMIDHHARYGNEVTAKQTLNDPSASSTCEMLYFLLKPTDTLSCTVLLLGIISDSGNFKYATARTFEATSALLANSDLAFSQVLALANIPESFSERIEALRSCKSVTAEKIGEYLIATAAAKSHEAHFADALITLGADLAFVGCAGEDGRISARMRESLRGKVKLDKLMFEIGKILEGSGSGHELAAGASGKKDNLTVALGICVNLAEQQILSAESCKIKEIIW